MRICFFGDSFVNGVGDPAGLGWVGRLCAVACARGYDVTCYNLGVRGDTSLDVAGRWREEATRRLKPEHNPRLVFSLGVNDACATAEREPLAPELTLGTVRGMLEDAKGFGPVLFVGPPPVAEAMANARVMTLSARLSELCETLRVPYLAIHGPLQASSLWQHEAAEGDGAHPGAPGYQELAHLVDAWDAWNAWVP